MKRQRLGSVLGMLALVSACGGDDGSSLGPGTGGANPPPVTTACSLRDRQNWAAAQLREWYLFPETLPASLDPAPYASVGAYVDALTATARSQRRDRYFTYVTSIAEENAYYAQGASAGFGFRLTLTGNRLYIAESFENAPALAAGIDRGAEILAIGTSAATLRSVSDILFSEGSAGLANALGPDTAGTARTFRIADAAGTREVTVAKADYVIAPVSSRYGARIIEEGGRRIGYVNLRTFISTADPALRQAFAQFRVEGVSDYIIDLRYNGGGLISIAELFGDLLSGGRGPNGVYSYTTFRPEKASENSTRFFQTLPQTVTPAKIAFIGTGSSASASEMLINAFLPYFRANTALIGTNTFGKPVGQIALDRAACDDRLRIVALTTENSARQGAYYDGLASQMDRTCQAADDLDFPLGDPREQSVARALDFLAGRTCTPIGATGAAARAMRVEERELLSPERPSTAQREMPGLF